MNTLKDNHEITSDNGKNRDMNALSREQSFLEGREQVFAYGAGEKVEKLLTATALVTDLFKPHIMAERLMGSIGRAHQYLFEAISHDHKKYYNALEEASVALLEYASMLRSATLSGLVSSMNRGILEKELHALSSVLEKEIALRDRGFVVTHAFEGEPVISKDSLSSTAFDRARFLQVTGNDTFERIQGVSSEQSATYRKSVLAYKKTDTLNKTTLNDIHRQVKNVSLDASSRVSDIMNMLRFNGPSDMKNIARVVPGVSMKTLQRDIERLIDSGKVIRVGVKRWSIYSLADSSQ